MTATMTDPQSLAREALHLIGIEVPDHITVVLTDTDDTGEHYSTVYAVNPSQIAYAVDQFRLVTGDPVDADALTSALPWL